MLFVRDRDPTRETWDGRRAGPDGATRDYGADDAFPIADIDDILPGLLENRARVYYAMGAHPEFDQRVIGWVNGLRTQARNGAPPAAGVRRARSRAARHAALQDRAPSSTPCASSARIAARRARARHAVLRVPGGTEYEVMAELLHEFRRHNADISYHPIVGGGANACVLHYRENDAALQDGDLLLIDAGCEFELLRLRHHAHFPGQRPLHAGAARGLRGGAGRANYAAIAKVQPGNHWNEPHEAAVRAITQGLVKLGLLKGQACRALDQGGRLPHASSCIAPVTGSAWTCTTSATTRSAMSGACSSRAWR